MDIEEKIKVILKEHEEHTPIYTCRLQISGAIMDLFHAYSKAQLLELVGGLENKQLMLMRDDEALPVVLWEDVEEVLK